MAAKKTTKKKAIRKPKPSDSGKRKKNGEPHPSSTGGPGKRVVDQSNWRRKLQESRIKFDDKAKEIFLNTYADTGRMSTSCDAAGVCMQTVREHVKNDPDFSDEFETAKEVYKDGIIKHHQNLIMNGVDEPIIGGKFKDKIVGYKRVYPTNLIAMELKKVDTGYRERADVNMNHRGGVLVMPAQITPEEWMAKYGVEDDDDPKLEDGQGG